ncbi:IclR family transcriptional regulator [Actinomadura sp. WAC 06369]|uniref:IclR family transcriptional regulator n=1 Tax=Actinomadura sp. WAC 06369 TaxID=2203193 RepID=UPI000F788029|nr:IclR family transcriptional regulator [Actinomadura sp. WAC 06369]
MGGFARERRRRVAESVRSLERAFELLEHLADAGGEMALSELTEVSGLPMPTIYRLMRTLVNRGYVRQEPSKRYALGPRLIRLGEGAGRLLGSWAGPVLSRLVDEVGETANMAVLEGDEAVYVAQVPSRHSMRMFTEVGRRVQPHCTGVGKALLSQLPEAKVREILARTGMAAHTPSTFTDPESLIAELARVRERGYALDEEEQEVGVRCVAVPLRGAPALTALSVSGPSGRLTRETVTDVVPIMLDAAERFARELGPVD